MKEKWAYITLPIYLVHLLSFFFLVEIYFQLFNLIYVLKSTTLAKCLKQ